jgi:hypothetical protein
MKNALLTKSVVDVFGESQYVGEIAVQIWCYYTLLSRAISPTPVLGSQGTTA